MKHFYAIRYIAGRSTTTGTPNPKTGRMNLAVDFYVFKSRSKRDEFVIETKNAKAVTKGEIRQYFQGMSLSEFNEMLELEILNADE